MGLYTGVPTIRTCIRTDGPVSLTQVWKDGKIIRVVPTHKSQIRQPEDYLWKVPPPENGGGTPYKGGY